MFRRFTVEEHVSAQCKVKSSAERAIKRAIVEQYPPLEEWIDEIIPKKAMVEAKAQNKVSIVVVDGEALFFSQRGGAWFPTLRLLHKYPTMMPRMQVDKGAIKFVMSGANIMCRGLTSPGASMEDVPADTPVAITAEGKTHTLAVGITKLSSADIRSINKDIGVDLVHYLNDGLWTSTRLKWDG